MKKHRTRKHRRQSNLRALAVGTGGLALVVLLGVLGGYLYDGHANLAAVIASGRITTFAPGTPSTISLSGYYVVLVPKNISLTTASVVVAGVGGTIAVDYTHLHALSAKLTSAQETSVAKSIDVSSVQPEVAATPAACALSSSSNQDTSNSNNANDDTSGSGTSVAGPTAENTGSPPGFITSSPVSVAIVDSGDHGNAVVATYQSACGSSCADPNPIIVDDSTGPNGDTTDASLADGIINAIQQGATIINVSAEIGTIPASAASDPNFNFGPTGTSVNLQSAASGAYNTAVLNALSLAAANNVIIVAAAGNNPNYENAAGTPNGTGATVVTVGADEEVDSATGVSLAPTDYSSPGQIYADGDAVGDADGEGAVGTSFAAPRITAAIANEEAQADTTQTPAQAVAAVEGSSSCTPISTSGGSSVSGENNSQTYTAPDGIQVNVDQSTKTPNVIVCEGGTCTDSSGNVTPDTSSSDQGSGGNSGDSGGSDQGGTGDTGGSGSSGGGDGSGGVSGGSGCDDGVVLCALESLL